MSEFNKNTPTGALRKTATSHPLGIDVQALAKVTPHHIFGPLYLALVEGQAAKDAGDEVAVKRATAKIAKLRDTLDNRIDTALNKLLIESRMSTDADGFVAWLQR